MLDFILTKENYLLCRKMHMRYEFFFRVAIELIGIALVIVMTTIVLKANKLPISIYFLTMGAWIVFCIFCNYKINKENMKEIEKTISLYDDINVFGHNTLSILENGLSFYNSKHMRVYPWDIIAKIKIINGNLYIVISSIEYICVPNGAYNEAKFNEFIKEIEGKKLSFIERNILRSII